jgi:hypothetical protein
MEMRVLMNMWIIHRQPVESLQTAVRVYYTRFVVCVSIHSALCMEGSGRCVVSQQEPMTAEKFVGEKRYY